LCISQIDIAGVGVGFEMEISVVDLLVAEFRPNPIATAASPAVTHMTARRIEASLPVQIEIGVPDFRAGIGRRSVSYFTLRILIILMETIKDLHKRFPLVVHLVLGLLLGTLLPSAASRSHSSRIAILC
jgi:hypothetical protein